LATTVAGALGIIGLLFLEFLEKSLREAVYQGLKTVSQSAAETVAVFLNEGLADTRAIAAIIAPADLENRNVAAVENTLATIAAFYPKFENGIFVLDTQGTLWADFPAAAQIRGQSFAHRRYFQQTMAENKAMVSTPYRSTRTGKPVVTFTAMLYDSKGQMIGMLGCSAPLLTPNALGGVRQTRIGQTGYVTIYDTSGQVIVHPQAERILQRDTPPEANGLLEEAIKGFEGVGRTVNVNGAAMLAATKRIAGTDWILAVQQPEQEAFASLEEARRRVLLGAVLAAVLAAGFGIVVVRWITRPLHALRTATLQLGQTGADESLKAITSRDEIGDLARTVTTINGQLGRTLSSLQEASVLWQRTFDAVADPVFIVDGRFRVMRVNQAAAAWLGQPAEAVVGQPGAQMIYGTAQPPYNCPHRQTMISGEMTRVIMESIRPGQINELTATALTDEKGAITGSVLILRDITAQKKAETALRESEEGFRDIVENSVEPIFSVDLKGRIMACNRATCAVLGAAERLIVGTSFKQWMEPSTAETVMAAFNGVFVSGLPLHDVRFEALRQDGRPLAVRGNVRLLVKGGEPIGFQAMMRDVSDQQRLDAQLQRSEKLEAIGTLAGGIAHDFNNFLAAIMGYLNLARLNAENDADVVRYLDSAEKVVSRASSLTRQLLTFSKGGKPIKELLPVASLVDEAATIALGKASGCRHEIHLAPDLRPVLADRGQIVQVLTNLLINARQAMPEGGLIRISARNCPVAALGQVGNLEPGNYVAVTVADQGPGIPESVRRRVFDPFFTTKKGGSGLGLATSHSIITRHGGHIEVDPAPARGAAVTFHLPAVDGRVETPAPVARDLHPGSGRILLMDDEESIRELCRDALSLAGYTVDVVDEGQKAIDRVKQALATGITYDLAIFDLTIPGGMGGMEAFGAIAHLAPAIKGIVTSGYSQNPVISDPQLYGFAAALQKPFRISDLTAAVKQVTGGRGGAAARPQ
jgi:PAS domain S-box-containing protein